MRKVNYIKIGATVISFVGFFLLIRVIYQAITGELIEDLNTDLGKNIKNTWFALGIGLPVPFHVISIGMILQKKWFTKRWKKIAWICIVTSGVWLGIALLVKAIIK